MKADVLNKLRCPSCKRKLALKSFLEEKQPEEVDGSGETSSAMADNGNAIIKEGVLLCPTCMCWYPIDAYVPVMLVFETRFHKYFAAQHNEQLQVISEYSAPKGSPNEDERSVQDTFTDERKCSR